MIHNKAGLGEAFVSVATRSAHKPRNWGVTRDVAVRQTEVRRAAVSMRPETVEPSLAIFTKISPGRPSSYRPTVM